jgi:hypothetical protein
MGGPAVPTAGSMRPFGGAAAIAGRREGGGGRRKERVAVAGGSGEGGGWGSGLVNIYKHDDECRLFHREMNTT